jgi:hypothetical protein
MSSNTVARKQLHRDRSASRERLDERIERGGFSVALSGGGHRATLAALGALLALVDRRLNRNVIQIASISGGSITNAFVAQRCAFETLEPGGLDGIASDLAQTIIDRGVLTRSWLATLVAAPPILGAVVVVIFVSVGLITLVAVAAGVVAALSLLMMAGLLVDWLLDRRYFRPSSSGSAGPLKDRHRASIASLSDRNIDHVFGMTDLVLGLPVYISSQQKGMLWRQLARGPSSVFGNPKIQTCDAGAWSIAEIVRASAAFPGIPPRRVLMPTDPVNPDVAAAPRVAFLADGGMWNNLGTQVLREDQFLGSHATRENGVPRPYWTAPNMPLLIINGSATRRPSQPWKFYVPGLASLAALLQTTRILSTNTVVPRSNAMMRSFQRRIWRARRPDQWDPLDLVLCFRNSGPMAAHAASSIL